MIASFTAAIKSTLHKIVMSKTMMMIGRMNEVV